MKKIFLFLSLLLFALAALFAVVLILKPGAAVFHIKRIIAPGTIKPLDGYAFSFPLAFNTRIFPPEGVMLYEDSTPLERSFAAQVIEEGRGSYALADQGGGSFNLIFSSTSNDDPTQNGRQYTIYLKPAIFSRATGQSILLLLGLGFAWFLVFIFKRPAYRKQLISNPASLPEVLGAFYTEAILNPAKPVTNKALIQQSRQDLWVNLLLITIAASFFYVFMEWIFFVTKPSFMDLMSWWEKTQILFISSFSLMLISLAIVLVFLLFDWLVSRFRSLNVFVFLGSLVPTFILTSIALILLDNFTYTIFNFGIVSSKGLLRFVYGLGFVMGLIFINRWILGLLGLRGEPRPTLKAPRPLMFSMLGLLVVSTLVSISMLIQGVQNRDLQLPGLLIESAQSAYRPNIILLGSDGLTADSMSLYGYERDTTPFLKELAETSLLAENAFTNSKNSSGSIVSILTGKPPAQTRVLYPPNILQGENAYQHLPGILRDQGYYSVEMGVPHYVDAAQANLMDSFDVVNGRQIESSRGLRFARELGFGNASYFSYSISTRLIDRLKHIFFIQSMENPFATVTQATEVKQDQEQLEQLSQLIQQSDDPIFAHVHLLGTHGPRFKPQEQKFSTGEPQDEDWMLDFYDDSIWNFDMYMQDFVESLERNGEFNDTLLILYSDHPMNYNVKFRVPMMFHFPGGEFSGRVVSNVQNIEIAPTILDYLDIEQPQWMSGQSLLDGQSSENELIYITGTNKVVRSEQRRLVIEAERVKPPFYQFSFFNIINCNQWYWFDLTTQIWESGEVPGHTRSCSSEELLSLGEIEARFAEYLRAHGFDTSTLPFQ